MANKTASASASKKKGLGRVKGMSVHLVSNGARSVMHHEPPADAGSMMGMMGGSVDGPETIHPSMAHLVKHIKNNLSDHFAANTGSGAGPATQPAATPASGGSAGKNDDEADEDEDE